MANVGNLIVTGNARVGNKVLASGFNRIGSSDSYALLGGGGHKVIDSSNTASAIVARDSSGYIRATYYNASCGVETPSTSSNIIYANSDGWFRKSSLANIKSILSMPQITTMYSGSSGVTFGRNNGLTHKVALASNTAGKFVVIKGSVEGYVFTTVIIDDSAIQYLTDVAVTKNGNIEIYFKYDRVNKLLTVTCNNGSSSSIDFYINLIYSIA